MVDIFIILLETVHGLIMQCCRNIVLVFTIEKKVQQEPLHQDMVRHSHLYYLRMENGWYMEADLKIKQDW